MVTNDNLNTESHYQTVESNKKNESTFYGKLSTVFYIFITVYYIANFLGLAQLKFIYLGFIILFGVMTFYLRPAEILPFFFPFALIEGQGRIIWAYHPAMRLIFDVFLIIVAVKAFIKNKKTIDRKAIPNYIFFLIFFHFCWYFVQLFNPNSISPFAVLTAVKIYIIPFILFFSFLTNDGLTSDKNLLKIRNLIRFTAPLAALLAIYQFNGGEQFLYKIHSYYKNIVGIRFSGALYRPFSTSHLPGGYASLLALFLPLLFVIPEKKKTLKALNFFIVGICLYAMFLAQVRSSIIKVTLALSLIHLGLFLVGKNRAKKIFLTLAGVTLCSLLFPYLPITKDINLSKYQVAIDRLTSITRVEDLASSREGPAKVISYILIKLGENPMGLGPGRTGGVSNLHLSKIDNDPVYNRAASWAWDNLFVSLTIDFGIGMFFYLLTIILLPIKLWNLAIRFYLKKDKRFQVVLVTASTTLIIFLGNWGGILLPYNPESFSYWYYVALGFKYVSTRNR